MKSNQKENVINYMLNEKTIMIFLTVGLLRKKSLYKMSYFPETHTHSKNEIKVELDLSHYAIKSEFKNAIGAEIRLLKIRFC